MISDSQMDKFFSDRLRDHSSSVPEDMWGRILEKRKRDRMIWLFFFRLFVVVVLSLALAGGYFVFNQKKSTLAIAMDSTKINQTPVNTDSVEASALNLPSGQDRMQLSQIEDDANKTNRKGKTRINYSDHFDQNKTNSPVNSASSKSGNSSKAPSATTGSYTTTDSIAVKENKTEEKKDSLEKKPIVKSSAVDSSKSKDLKKPETKDKSKNPKWWLDLYASPDYPIVSPNEREQSKLSYTIGIKLNWSLGKHFSIKTGIQYSQINFIQGDSGLGIIHLKRLDMPVLAGYSIGNGNLKTTINGGVIFSWLQNAPDIFENNTGVSLYLGLDFEKKNQRKILLVWGTLLSVPAYNYDNQLGQQCKIYRHRGHQHRSEIFFWE